MISFLLDTANMPFTVALAIVGFIALVEGVGIFLGIAFSSVLDNLLPEMEVNIDTPDMTDHGAFGEFLAWLRFREVPVIVILIAFLTSFSVTGFALQQISSALLGFLLPAFVASLLVTFICLPGVRFFAGVLSKIMPRDESEAVHRSSFIGRPAEITLGTASARNPAQGRLKDKFGHSHYVMIEPDMDDQAFAQGEEVLIVRQKGSTFFAIKNT